jgi:hypothetical protein
MTCIGDRAQTVSPDSQYKAGGEAALQTSDETMALALLGLVFAVFVLVAIATAFVVQLRQQWARIAVSVVGSWIAASGLLMLGWAARGSLIHH